MQIFEKSRWIWLEGGQSPDSYVDFTCPFSYEGGEAILHLSVDTDYALFINGDFVCSNQYGDYPHYKVYDSVAITDHLKKGQNRIDFLVYYCGVSTNRYYASQAGLIFQLDVDGKVALVSDESVKSRLNPNYQSGRKVFVTSQLGFTVFYDANASQTSYSNSKIVDKNCNFFARPIKKATLKPMLTPKSVQKISDSNYIIDLGGEAVGLLTFKLKSLQNQTVLLSWGELLVDGHVRRTVKDRTFTITYKAKAGLNCFTEYMLRLGCRYIEIAAEKPIELDWASIIPQVYEVKQKSVVISDQLDEKIYRSCVKTLRCSMMEHYVDCPWREQALYTCDSRNQILCGYYAFENGNADYVKANLRLMSEDYRKDGLLSICYPSGHALQIPSFSLHYVFAMRDYLDYTGDRQFIAKYFNKIVGVIDAMLNNRKNGLVCKIESVDAWNFYEWSQFSDGHLFESEPSRPDLAINSFTVMAINDLEHICNELGLDFCYAEARAQLIENARRAFYRKGLFTMHEGEDHFTQLGGSLAILSGIATAEQAKSICKSIERGETVACTLSMKLFQYQAMLSVSPSYEKFILDEIRANYQYMLSSGHDTFWETIKGWQDFNQAGSLCHGWSALPIYFFHKFGIARYEE